MKLRKIILASTAVVGLAMVAGGYAMAEDAEVVTVGYTGPMSGGAAAWGIGMAEGIQKAFKDYGVVTIADKPYRFELLVYDDGYKTETAVANAQRMIQEHEVKFAATMGGAIGVVTEPVMSDARVLQFHLGAAEAYLGKDKPLSLRAHMSSLDAFYVYWPWIAKNFPEVKTVAVFEPEDDTGRQSMVHEEKAVEEAGLNLVASEFVPRTTTDFYPILTKVLAQKPDALSFYNPPGQQPIAAKQARELGFTGPIFLPSMETSAVVTALGEQAEGIVNPVALTVPLTDKAKKVQSEWEAESKKVSPALLLDGYNIGEMLIRSATVAGTVTDTAAVNKALHEIEFNDTVFGRMCWHEVNGINNALYAAVAITVVKDGKEELLDVAQPPCQ